MIGGDPGPDTLEIQDREVVAALHPLGPDRTIDWLGVKSNLGTFERKDGLTLQVWRRPSSPWDDGARYSGNLSPARQADGYDTPGYPTKEDATLTELVAWLAAWDGSEVDLTEMLERAPTVRFPWTVARSVSVDRLLAALATPRWRFVLAALYLAKGEYVPDLAKISGPKATTGVAFGFCDEGGALLPRAEATHAGWRFDEDPEEGA